MREEILMEYLEGRLSARGQAKVEQHLSKCNSCLEEFLIAERMLHENHTAHFETVPGYLTKDIINKLEHQHDNTIIGSTINFIRSIPAFF